MIVTLQDFFVQEGQSAGSEPDILRELKSAISLFERHTGILWERRENKVREIRTDMGTCRTGILFSVSNLSVSEVKDWNRTPVGVTALTAETDNVAGDYRVTSNFSHGYVIPVSRHWRSTVRVTFSCGHTTLPDDVPESDLIRTAIVSQVAYTLRRNRGDLGVRDQVTGRGGAAMLRSTPMSGPFETTVNMLKRSA